MNTSKPIPVNGSVVDGPHCLGECAPQTVGTWLSMPPAWFRGAVWVTILVLAVAIAWQCYRGAVEPEDIVLAARNLNVIGVALLGTMLVQRLGGGQLLAVVGGGVGAFVVVQGGWMGLNRVLADPGSTE